MRWVWIILLPFAVFANETVVESEEAYYNGHMITLTGAVSVENAMGRVTADKAVLTRDEESRTKIDFPWIELTRAVTLTLPSGGGRLTCEKVLLDYTNMTSHFTGIPQVAYFDERGEVWADEAYVDYIDTEGSIKPTKVSLIENVKLVFLENAQYALADRVTYYPDEQLTVLEGTNDKRVLFYDKQHDMELSAHTVRAKRNPETNREMIQGVGDVRFVFGQEELTRFKGRFKW